MKNGSKILARVAASIPQPESATERTTNGPDASSVGTCSASTFAVLIVSVPPAGHRVPRVQGEVDEHLLDLARIRLHVPEVRAERGDHLDVLADQAVQHLVGVDDDRVEVDDARLQHLLAPEGEELLRQRRGALCRLLDRLHVRPLAGLARVEAAEQEAAVHGDDGQEVVEVVRDAAGEAADGVELLRLVEALLELLAVADVVHHPDGELGVPVRVAHDRRRQVTPDDLAVGAAVALLECVALPLSLDELVEQPVRGRGLVGRGELRQLLADELLTRNVPASRRTRGCGRRGARRCR